MSQGTSISKSLTKGIHFAALNWTVIFFAWLANLVVAGLAVLPLNSFFNSSIGKRPMTARLSEGFDYAIIADLLRGHSSVFEFLISSLSSTVILYLIWNLFYTGGFMALIKGRQGSMSTFWKGGACYFFRLLGMFSLLSILASVFFFICYKSMMMLGLNPFHLVSEEPVISRIRLLAIIGAIFFFFLSLFRDLVKVGFMDTIRRPFAANVSKAFIRIFTLKNLALAIINTILLFCIFLVFFFIKKLSIGSALLVFLLGQLLLLLRFIYKFVRLSSFYHANTYAE